MHSSRFLQIRQHRIQKLNQLQQLGINPFPSTAQKDLPNQTLIDHFDQYQGQTKTLTGRIMSLRKHGALTFLDLQDQSGTIQVVLKRDQLHPTSAKHQFLGYQHLNLIDVGDFIQVTGTLGKTKTGTISLMASSLKLLTKSIRPLPEKWEGLKDPEIIFRRRYLDFTMNPEKREIFIRKSRFWRAARQFMHQHGFIEVETPVMEHVTGGADARPFVTHHHALDEDFYLRISTELYQKRLIGGGFEKVFTLGPNFRNEGIDAEHLQEYYQLEWYWAYANYRDNMKLVQDLFLHLAQEVYGKTTFTRGQHTFDLTQDWQEIDYVQIIHDRFDIDVFQSSEADMLAVLRQHNLKLTGSLNRARLVDNLWKLIRKTITGPAFLVNHPKFISPLAKSQPDNPQLTERFQVIIAGSELGNGYSELNHPFDQLDRFLEQQKAREAGDEEAQMLDLDFVEMLEYGMPPTSGYGQSERVFWFFENLTAREGTLFPQMKRRLDPLTQQIYNLQLKESDALS